MSGYAKLARANAVIICVPTPLTANREPDLGPLVQAAAGVRGVQQAGQLVVVESTTCRDGARPPWRDAGAEGRKPRTPLDS